MDRKKILKKRLKLFQEINEMVKFRDNGDCYYLNNEIKKKKKEYKFYSNLLKNM